MRSIAALLTSCVFGSGADALDLDRVEELGPHAHGALEGMLHHPTAVGAALKLPGMRIIDDMVFQLPVYACIGAWTAEQSATTCAAVCTAETHGNAWHIIDSVNIFCLLSSPNWPPACEQYSTHAVI